MEKRGERIMRKRSPILSLPAAGCRLNLFTDGGGDLKAASTPPLDAQQQQSVAPYSGGTVTQNASLNARQADYYYTAAAAAAETGERRSCSVETGRRSRRAPTCSNLP
ncbi:hypothetical protein INR49_002349 [Caranx melampygus]|nr:hypothetical protein INR49_002349 [Caranx melampygus]